MTFLIFLALLVGVTVVPVMIGARVVGAKNTGFGSALLAVIVLAAVSICVEKIIGNQFLVFVISSAAGGVMLSIVLGTSFWRGIGVSVITVVIQTIVIVVFAGAVIGVAAA